MSRLTRWACLALVVSGCLPTGAVAPEAELSKNEALWERREPTTYEFIFQRSCECLPEHTMPMKVTVHERQIRSVVDASSGEPVATESHGALRIDEIFAAIRIALEGGAHRVDVTYDPVHGHPTSLYIDHHPQYVDDEVRITAKDFNVID